MAETQLTVRQIMDLGLWDRVCEYKGWSIWSYNEGQIEDDELVTFDSEFKKEEDKHILSEEHQWELKSIVKQLNKMAVTLHPHSAGHIDEAVMLLEKYID